MSCRILDRDPRCFKVWSGSTSAQDNRRCPHLLTARREKNIPDITVLDCNACRAICFACQRCQAGGHTELGVCDETVSPDTRVRHPLVPDANTVQGKCTTAARAGRPSLECVCGAYASVPLRQNILQCLDSLPNARPRTTTVCITNPSTSLTPSIPPDSAKRPRTAVACGVKS